ncbi:MAG: zinc ABC transporter substrate-binding protein [Planctomycetes bacterium]|nr:zinc ABC transporter substrate-binding protein [Planctomycetota bacterium]
MRNFYVFLLMFIAIISGCQKQAPASADSDKFTVLVSILPQKYFVERIAGNKVNVLVLLPTGAFPASYEPATKQFVEIAKAKIFFMVGHPKFALETSWADKIQNANKNMKVIKLANKQDYGDSNLDPHVWIAPGLVKKQLTELTDALLTEMPDQKEFFNKNKDIFIQDIDALTNKIKEKLASVKSKKFLVFHPAWGYFAKEFGLEQIAIEQHGHESGHHSTMEIIELAKKHNITVVFAQKQYSSKEAETVAKEIGGKVIKIDPLAENWLENLELVSDTLLKHLQ